MNNLFLIVTGMHRSGTSALAGGLQRLGVNFGREEELLEPALDNPLGYFEKASVVALNDELLRDQGWEWDSIPAHAEPNEASWRPYIDQGREILDLSKANGPQGIKDPRISLTLTFWRSLLLDRCIAIRIFRDPAEVIWSLKLRNGISTPFAAGLVMSYERNLEKNLDGLPTLNISYETLVREPLVTMTGIFGALVEVGVNLHNDDGQIEAAARSIQPLLQRTSFPAGLESSEFVRAVSMSRRISSLGEFEFKTHVPHPIAPSLWEREVLDWRMAHRKVERKLQSSQETLTAQLGDLHQEVAVRDERIGHLDQEVAVRDERIGHLDQEVGVRDQALQARDTYIAELSAEVQQVQGRVLKLRATLDQSHLENKQLRTSKAFRLGMFITWPARHLRAALTRHH